MKHYVLGFLFSTCFRHVVLIQKNRPEWQAGLLNGVGGHIEPADASAEAAMEREFEEETALSVTGWRSFAFIHGDDWTVEIFTTTHEDVWHVQTVTDEGVAPFPVSAILNDGYATISNLRWLLPLAIDTLRERPGDQDRRGPQHATIKYTTQEGEMSKQIPTCPNCQRPVLKCKCQDNNLDK